MIDAVGFALGLILVLWEWNRSAVRERAYRSGEQQRSVTNHLYRPILQVRLRIRRAVFRLFPRKRESSGFVFRDSGSRARPRARLE